MSEEYKRLYRSNRDRMIAGVCGGMAEYFAIDPTIIRLIFVGAAFLNPPGAVLAYIVMMIVVPVTNLPASSDK